MKESSASPESFGEEELTAYLLGELDVPTSQRLEQRLSEDPELRQLLKELSGSMELIREAFGNPVEQGAPLHLNPSRRSSMQDRFKERAGSHVRSGVFSGAFLQWGLPMSLAASLVVGMAWLHFMHGGGIERSASTSTWSFLAKETSETPIAQTALTRSAPQVPQSGVRPSADAMGSGKLARVEALQETWDVEDALQSGNAEAPLMALDSAHGLSRKPQVSDLSEGLEGFQDEGVDRDRDFGLSTHANGLVAIDETTEQWNLPEPQQPQSDSVMMQRYGLLPSDENGRLSVRSNRPSAPDPSTGSQEALARQVRGRKAGVETQRPLNRGSMAPENADRYFFGASSGEAPTVLNESLYTNAGAGPQDEKHRVSPDPVIATNTSQRFQAENQAESNLSQLDFESSVASPNPSMTESSDALGLGFSHSATERFRNTATQSSMPRNQPSSSSLRGATQPLARSSMPGLAGAASMADREAQGGVQEAVQEVESEALSIAGIEPRSGDDKRVSAGKPMRAAQSFKSLGERSDGSLSMDDFDGPMSESASNLSLGDTPQLGALLAGGGGAGGGGMGGMGGMAMAAGKRSMNEPALGGVARGWAPQAPVANRSEPLRQAKDVALFESSEAALESSSAFGRRRAGPLRPDLSLGGDGAVMAGDRLKSAQNGSDNPSLSSSLNASSIMEKRKSPMRGEEVTLSSTRSKAEKKNAMPLSLGEEVDKGRMLLGRAEALAEKDGLERSEIPSTQQPQPSASISHPPEKEALQDPISTFSLNVSDVSFELAKASLEQGRLPDPVHIRSEQFLNAFDYQDPLTHSQESISFFWERGPHPWAHRREVLRLSMRASSSGREMGRPMHLVLLLDHSGSMERSDRRSIIQDALQQLCQALKPKDKLSVVGFANRPRLWVDGASAENPESLLARIENLQPEGGTHLEDALTLAYEVAHQHFVPEGINRVILLTDGAANLGDVRPERLSQQVEAERIKGIALDCFGVGWEGFNDTLLERLSRNGDGRYGFLNDVRTAGTTFADMLAGSLKVAASNVKVQVEWNPRRIRRWRQMGYAMHQLRADQFRDASVDAGELAAAESGQALYILEADDQGEGPIATVRVRYLSPETSQYAEKEWVIPYRSQVALPEEVSPSLRLATTAGLFAEWLNGHPHAIALSIPELQSWYRPVPIAYGNASRPRDLERMLEQARSISGL